MDAKGTQEGKQVGWQVSGQADSGLWAITGQGK